MKKFVKGLAVLGVMASLVSCATKTDFATFKEKAVAAAKQESPYVKATVKGTAKDKGSETKVNFKYNKKGLIWVPAEADLIATTIGAVVFTNNVVFYAGAEVADATYYVGSTFKYELGDLTVKFNKYGQVTSYAGEGYKLTVSYSK